MAKVMTDPTHYHAIAQSIRRLSGEQTGFLPAQMAEAVTDAWETKLAGLWDAIQNGGQKVNFFISFAGPYWNDETFCPKYDICPTMGAQYMFRNCGVTDMKAILDRQGVRLDLSGSSNYYYIFGNAAVTRLPELDMSRSNLSECFFNCKDLVSIEKLKIKDGATFQGVFNGCAALEEVTFEGTITQDLYLEDSPRLTHGTLLHILDVLGTVSGKTLTLGTVNLQKLSEEEKAVATGKGWTLA